MIVPIHSLSALVSDAELFANRSALFANDTEFRYAACGRNSDGCFAQIATRQYSSMAGPTLSDCRLPELRRHHRSTAGQAQTRTYPHQRSSTGSHVPYRFRADTGPCVGTGGGMANSGKEVRDSKAAPQHGELRTNLRSCQKGRSRFG